jgi:hypothetical protein
MPGSTRATLLLSNLDVSFALHTYGYDPRAERIGLQAAEALGVEPRRVLKTLMAARCAWGNRGGAGGVSIPCVPDAVRHSSCRSAEPGPHQTSAFVTAPALQRTASQEP